MNTESQTQCLSYLHSPENATLQKASWISPWCNKFS